ncbi:MAG TPA: protein-disulfide reductase DsbD domain-containing protein [Gammaproteobacteria bacterium]|nr:protein-disulfide reductase DsbD domain-containing protein [Gammaproteobacteria bacterium]
MDRRQRFFLRLSIVFGAIVAATMLGARAQVSGADLLPLSEAFRLEVSRPQAERVRITWTIAEGYYLYRHRFRFETAPAKVREGFTLPPGIVKQDPFFGESQIYRRSVDFELPLDESAARLDRISLRVVSQGCADVGICFPPEARTADLAVGETVIPEAGDPFSLTGADKPADRRPPPSPKRSGPFPTGSSP